VLLMQHPPLRSGCRTADHHVLSLMMRDGPDAETDKGGVIQPGRQPVPSDRTRCV